MKLNKMKEIAPNNLKLRVFVLSKHKVTIINQFVVARTLVNNSAYKSSV